MHFNGLSSFGNRVVFIKAKEDDSIIHFSNFVKKLKSKFEENGFSCNPECWTPHATIMKTSKIRSKRKNV